jgi:hypothetical protein
MIDLIAQSGGTDLPTIIGTALGAALAVVTGNKGLERLQKYRANGAAYNKAVCDERHERINKDMDTLFQKLDKQGDKLDQIHVAVMKHE